MAFIADSKYDFVVQPTQAKKMGLPPFYMDRILSELVSETMLKKYFFGSSRSFEEIVNDKFIEGLIIIKYIVKVIRETKPSDVKKFKVKYKKHESIRYTKTPSLLSVVNQKLLGKGILLDSFRHILMNRIDVVKTCDELGLTKIYPDLDLSSTNVIDQIARLKKCIYSGYKNNLAVLSESGAYYTITGQKIKIKGIKRRSKRVIYGSSVLMMPDFGAITYGASCNIYSSLDGWI
jgi:hypothetical protein